MTWSCWVILTVGKSGRKEGAWLTLECVTLDLKNCEFQAPVGWRDYLKVKSL